MRLLTISILRFSIPMKKKASNSTILHAVNCGILVYIYIELFKRFFYSFSVLCSAVLPHYSEEASEPVQYVGLSLFVHCCKIEILKFVLLLLLLRQQNYTPPASAALLGLAMQPIPYQPHTHFFLSLSYTLYYSLTKEK